MTRPLRPPRRRHQPRGLGRRSRLALDAFGTLNVLVNNAGIVYRRRLRNLERERWQRVLDVNLTGTMLGMRAVIDR